MRSPEDGIDQKPKPKFKDYCSAAPDIGNENGAVAAAIMHLHYCHYVPIVATDNYMTKATSADCVLLS